MRNMLIPLDGSRAAEAAVKAIVAQAQREPVGAIHLLHVRRPMGHYVRQFIDRATIREFQREEGERALAGSRRLLDAAGLRYHAHVRIGAVARMIADTADELGVDEIVMAADGGGVLASLRLWLLIGAVRRHATVPVVLRMSPERRRGHELPLPETRPAATH